MNVRRNREPSIPFNSFVIASTVALRCLSLGTKLARNERPYLTSPKSDATA
jgi:hypothetical protein